MSQSTDNANCLQKAELSITGVGITSAIGHGRSSFEKALFNGESRFGVMQRPGRQNDSNFLGAEISDFECKISSSSSAYKTTSFSIQTAVKAISEAWSDAGLDSYDPERIGLIVGGSNFQQRETSLLHDRYKGNSQFVRPTYGYTFMDTDICSTCTSIFKIKGIAFTVGGASASGQLAVIEAAEAIEAGRVDVCIAVGALMDISYWECQAMRSLGAMGSDKFANAPEMACRPFDAERDGFIYGEACGAVVLESTERSRRRPKQTYAHITGWASHIDGKRTTAPNEDGEVSAIKQALAMSKLEPKQVDYINPHGTGSMIGDPIELQAIKRCGLEEAHINATKSVTGHGLTAAGTVEIISTALQISKGKLHPTLNLNDPIDNSFNWVREKSLDTNLNNAISLSLGFGGINTAVCLSGAA